MTIEEVMIVLDVEKVERLAKRGLWVVGLKGVGIKVGAFLIGVCGRGKTKKEAWREYAEKLCGRMVIVHAMMDSRREVKLPAHITSKPERGK